MSRTMTLLLLLAVPLPAMDLVEAVSIALENRGDVGAARLEAESAEWQRRGADLWFLPSVSFSAAFIRSHDVTMMDIPGVGSFPTGSEYSSQAGISAAVPLFTARGPAGSRLAGASEDMAGAALAAAEQDAVLEVVMAFYGVMLAEELSSVSDEALSIAGEGFRIAGQRFEAGTISRFELLQSSVAWENRKPEALAARNALENARAALAVAVGLPGGTWIEVEGDLSDPLPVDLPSTLEEARGIQAARSPEYATAEAMRSAGEASLSMAGAAFAPSVILTSDYVYRAAREDWHFEADDYDRSWSTMIAVEVPIFDQMNDISSYNSARAGMLSARASAGSLEQYAGLGLLQAWNDYAGALEAVSATSATVDQAEEGASIAAISYEAGVITRLESDQALLALTLSRTNHANSLYGLRGAEARLARALGLLEI